MINKELIIKKIEEINSFLDLLENYKDLEMDKFLNDRNVVDATKFRLINIMEACMNICSHIVIKMFNKIPESYVDCFKILGEKGIIDKELSINLIKMAKFRNLLIHLYSKVDDSEIYKILKQNLVDIKKFMQEIKKLI